MNDESLKICWRYATESAVLLIKTQIHLLDLSCEPNIAESDIK